MRETIYIISTKQNSYQKVTATPHARRNLGIIEHDGHLNIKPELRAMIQEAGGDFAGAPGYHAATNGSTHGVGGSGYDSYASFRSVAAATEYLKEYFDVV